MNEEQNISKHHIKTIVIKRKCTHPDKAEYKYQPIGVCTNDVEMIPYCGECFGYKPESEFIKTNPDGSVLWDSPVCYYYRDVEKHIAFDCANYEFDEDDGFKSRNRYYYIEDLLYLEIDGEVVFDDR